MKQLWYFRLFYSFFFFASAMIFSQTAVFLEQKGLSGTEIGFTLATISLAATISQPIVGFLADRFKNRSSILRILLLGAATCIFLLPSINGFLPIVTMVFIFSLFLEPTFTLADTTVIEAARYEPAIEYGKVRWFGSIAWGIGSLALGIILQFLGGFSTAFTLFTVLALFAVGITFTFPKHQTKQAETIDWHAVKQLVRYQPFIFICSFSFFVGGVSLTVNNYLALHLTQLGAMSSVIGVAMFLPTLLEITTFQFSGRLINHFGIKRIFLAICLILTLVQLSFFFAPHFLIVMVGMMIQGLIFPLTISAIYQFLNEYFDAHVLTTVSTIRAMFAAGISTFIFTFIAGIIFEFAHLAFVFAMTALLMSFAFLLVWRFFPQRSAHRRQSKQP